MSSRRPETDPWGANRSRPVEDRRRGEIGRVRFPQFDARPAKRRNHTPLRLSEQFSGEGGDVFGAGVLVAPSLF